MAGTTNMPKNRVTERLIRIPPTNHTLIRCVNRDSVKDSRNLAGAPLRLGQESSTVRHAATGGGALVCGGVPAGRWIVRGDPSQARTECLGNRTERQRAVRALP